MMKTSITILSLFRLAAAQQFTFCPPGTSLPDPQKLVKLSSSTQTTCGSLEKEASKGYMVRTYGRNYYQYYAHLCRCEEPEEEIQECNLCQDGEEIPSETNVQRSSTSSQLCQEYAIQAKFDPFRQGCGYFNFLGSLCGCVKNRPPFDGCTLCADGSEPTLPDTVVNVPGVIEGGTCAKYADFTRYAIGPESPGCGSSQATVGTYCGCPSEEQPAKDCPLCEEGAEVTNDPAPEFSFLSANGQTRMYQMGKSCLEAEMLAHQVRSRSEHGEDNCLDIREQLADRCCQSAPKPKPAAAGNSTAGNYQSTVGHEGDRTGTQIAAAEAAQSGAAAHGIGTRTAMLGAALLVGLQLVA